MAKKNFSGGLNSLLQNTTGESQENEKLGKTKRAINKTSELGTKDGETRATYIVTKENNEKIKAIAYWDREEIKEIVNKAFIEFISKYENEKGEIKPIPKK